MRKLTSLSLGTIGLGSLTLYLKKGEIGTYVDKTLNSIASSFSNYLEQAFYASKKIGTDITSAANYYFQQISPINQQLGSNVATCLALLFGSISLALLVAYLTERED